MTDRPTPPYPGYLDRVLDNVENGIAGGTVDPKGWEAYLAAEVRALRAELAEVTADRDLMASEVERLEAVVDSYRDELARARDAYGKLIDKIAATATGMKDHFKD